MSQQSFVNWIRQPASIILVIAFVIMFLMLTDQSQQQDGMSSDQRSKTSITTSMDAPNAAMPLPGDMAGKTSRVMGGELPKIVQRLGSPVPGIAPKGGSGADGRLTAPDLGSLLGRLEDKVKAEPNNVSNRLLLAQTYNELGLVDKALEEVRASVKQFPDHSRAKLVLAAILSKRKNETELKEAVGVLKGLRGDKEAKQYLVEMYLGDAWIRMGEHQSAMKSWKIALEGMPVSDNRRAKLEKGIAGLVAGNPGT